MSTSKRGQSLALYVPSDAGFDRPLSLIGWFDDQMSRIQRDLLQNEFYNQPKLARLAFDPVRRSRLFDALFSDNTGDMELKFKENPNKNQVECQVTTGCGDFFGPEDIEINVKGRNVEFKARREQKSEDGHNFSVREVQRVFQIPENAEVDKLKAEMGPNGKILLTAPLVKPKAIEKKEPVAIKINKL